MHSRDDADSEYVLCVWG